MLWTMTFWIRRVAMDTRILIRKEAQSVHKFLTYVCYSGESSWSNYDFTHIVVINYYTF